MREELEVLEAEGLEFEGFLVHEGDEELEADEDDVDGGGRGVGGGLWQRVVSVDGEEGVEEGDEEKEVVVVVFFEVGVEAALALVGID